MDEETLSILRRRLDAKVVSMSEMIKKDIYENIIVSTVMDWFAGSDSILDLNRNIKNNVEHRWPYIEKKIQAQLYEFEEQTKATLEKAGKIEGQQIDVNAISATMTEAITMVIGAIGTTFFGVISGGGGLALIESGPIGWIIGAIIGAFVFFFGKAAMEEGLRDFIKDKKIPSLIKRTAKGKVASQLKLNESRFEQEIHGLLEKQLQPIYEALEHGLSK